MTQAPRPASEPVLTRRHWTAMGAFGLVLTASVLASLWLAIEALGLDERQAVTVSFLTLGLGQTLHVFNMRVHGSGIAVNEVTRNPWIWGAVALCVLLLAATRYLPGLSHLLETREPGARGWALIATMSAAPLVLGQLLVAGGLSRPDNCAPPPRGRRRDRSPLGAPQ